MWLITDMNQIFQIRYYELLQTKELQGYKLSKLPRPKPHSSIVILAERDQGILIIFDHELSQPITLLKIVVESPIVPYLKDLIHICLENESQGHSMTFNMGYLCSKYPYFISYRGLCKNRKCLHCNWSEIF